MTSLAPFLPRPAEPPLDARFRALGAPNRWEGLASDGVETGREDGVLTLAPLPDAASATDGSLWGFGLPSHFATAPDGRHVLLDRESERLKLLEPCLCRFAAPPHLAVPGATAVLIAGQRLYVSLGGADPRVQVWDRRALILRAEWRPPAAPGRQPGVMALAHGILWLADAGTGALLRFALHGAYLGAVDGIGAVAALQTDGCGALWMLRQASAKAQRIGPDGTVEETAPAAHLIADRFDAPPARSLRDGSLLVHGCQHGPARFAPDGTALPPPPDALLATRYELKGQLIGPRLDSGIETCQWHRIVAMLDLPEGCRVAFSVLTANLPLDRETVLSQPDSAWTSLPSPRHSGDDALITARPGRYLWLRATLQGPGDATPALTRVKVEFPRVSLAEHLPPAFHADPVASDFTTRFVAVMDRPLRDVEARIDTDPARYDPDSAPALAEDDMLGLIARWIGLEFEPRWSEDRRRRLLRAYSRVLKRIGTPEALRALLFAYAGWTRPDPAAHRTTPDACPPRCGLPDCPGPDLPPLILEHWRLRRWLFLGAGRLGDAAVLWGAGILDRAILDRGATLGRSRIDGVRDALRDPFHHGAHIFSLFLPARLARDPAERGAIARLVALVQPAHTAARLIWVAPRMRVGVQASIGFDSVIARYPEATARLGDMQLGRGSVTPTAPADRPTRLGRTSHLGPHHGAAPPSKEGRP